MTPVPATRFAGLQGHTEMFVRHAAAWRQRPDKLALYMQDMGMLSRCPTLLHKNQKGKGRCAFQMLKTSPPSRCVAWVCPAARTACADTPALSWPETGAHDGAAPQTRSPRSTYPLPHRTPGACGRRMCGLHRTPGACLIVHLVHAAGGCVAYRCRHGIRGLIEHLAHTAGRCGRSVAVRFRHPMGRA